MRGISSDRPSSCRSGGQRSGSLLWMVARFRHLDSVRENSISCFLKGFFFAVLFCFPNQGDVLFFLAHNSLYLLSFPFSATCRFFFFSCISFCILATSFPYPLHYPLSPSLIPTTTPTLPFP